MLYEDMRHHIAELKNCTGGRHGRKSQGKLEPNALTYVYVRYIIWIRRTRNEAKVKYMLVPLVGTGPCHTAQVKAACSIGVTKMRNGLLTLLSCHVRWRYAPRQLSTQMAHVMFYVACRAQWSRLVCNPRLLGEPIFCETQVTKTTSVCTAVCTWPE